MEKMYEGLKNTKPEIAAIVKQRKEHLDKMLKLYEKEYSKEITIDSKPAIITAYKSGFIIEIKFRDQIERDAAIEKLTK